MDTIAVSILSYNNSNVISRAIKSILDQTRLPDELIIVDDDSNDNSIEVISDLIKDYAWMKVISNPVNLGVSNNRIKAIESTTSRFIMNLDADDFLEKNTIKNVLAILKNSPNSIVVSDYKILDQSMSLMDIIHTNIFCSSSKFKKLYMLGGRIRGCPGTGNHFAFSRESYLKIGGYTKNLTLYEDWDLVTKFVMANYEFINTNKIGFSYVKNSAGLSNSHVIKHIFSTFNIFIRNLKSSDYSVGYLSGFAYMIFFKGPIYLPKLFKKYATNKKYQISKINNESNELIDKSNLAPICLFTYNRLPNLINTVSSLQNNYLSRESDLIVYSDGPKNQDDFNSVASIRTFIGSLSGFKSIRIVERPFNFGLSKSIISAINDEIKKYGRLIIVEDDLILSKNFLIFMNSALVLYKNEKNILSISGYTHPLKSMLLNEYDSGFSNRAYSWGIATWEDRWFDVSWISPNCSSEKVVKNCSNKFVGMGSDLNKMLNDQLNGVIDSWFISWLFHQHNNQLLSVFPKISKVKNMGFAPSATHTVSGAFRFNTRLDDGYLKKFKFDTNCVVNSLINHELKFYNSYLMRFFYRLRAYNHLVAYVSTIIQSIISSKIPK